MIIRLYILTFLDLSGSRTTILKTFHFIPSDLPQFSWKLELYRWSSRRKPAGQTIIKRVEFDFSA